MCDPYYMLTVTASNRTLNLSQEEVLLLAQSVRAGDSPTDRLLHHMNTIGLTTLDLYQFLKRSNLIKAMDIVKDYGMNLLSKACSD